jgi:hypothetical protein
VPQIVEAYRLRELRPPECRLKMTIDDVSLVEGKPQIGSEDKPVQNAFVESFNGKFRDECLNQSWFVSLADAVQGIEAWRLDYNRVRPHSSLGDLTPEEFARKAA